MKRYIVTLVLFISAITSRSTFGDTWIPGSPKPASSVSETWLADLTGFFCDMWSYLMY